MDADLSWIYRFWKYVDKKGVDDCWEWTGAKTSNGGYGQLTLPKHNVQRAHRLSYFLANGYLDTKLFIRHKCDNPSCVNPNHLVEGTHQDNMNDMVERGRHKLPYCKNGHEYTEENTIHKSNGGRLCATCRAESRKKEKAKYREKRGDMFGKPVYKVRTHCPNNHKFSDENTYIRPDGYKECRTCRLEKTRAFRRKSKAN